MFTVAENNYINCSLYLSLLIFAFDYQTKFMFRSSDEYYFATSRIFIIGDNKTAITKRESSF